MTIAELGITEEQLYNEVSERLEAEANGRDGDKCQIHTETSGYTLDELIEIETRTV